MLKLTLLLVLLWLPSLIMGIDYTDNFFAWRHQLIMLTGVLGLGYMCFATLLAARFRWIESKIKGLDNGYALHKQQLHFKKIELFYCVNSKKEAFFANEIASILCHLDFIELHILDAQKGELLDSEQIIQKVGGKHFDVSFCGPASFAEQLKVTLRLPENRFHRELFKMR